MLVQPPLGRGAIICPIFIHSPDFTIGDFQKRGHMERTTPVRRVDPCDGDDQIPKLFDSLNLTIPQSRILTICHNVFLNRKLFVCSVPVDNGIGMKEIVKRLGILGKDCLPKCLNVHTIPSFCNDGKIITPFWYFFNKKTHRNSRESRWEYGGDGGI